MIKLFTRSVAACCGLLLLVAASAFAQPAPVQAAFDRHSHLLQCSGADCHDRGFAFTLAVACDLRPEVALYRKDGGTRCQAPNGQHFDCEKIIVVSTGDMYDIVVSHGIPAQRPAWQHVASNVRDSKVTAPPCDGGSVPPPPPPPPPPPSPDLAALLARLDQLQAALVDTRAQVFALVTAVNGVDANVRTLMERTEVVISQNEVVAQMLRNPPAYVGSVRLLGSFRLNPEQR